MKLLNSVLSTGSKVLKTVKSNKKGGSVGNSGSPIAIFPLELREDSTGWPCVHFTTEGKAVFLPIPPGITFGDGMSYGSINLGLLGDSVIRATNELLNKDGGIKERVQNLGRNIVSEAKSIKNSLSGAAAGSIAARTLGFGETADFFDYSQKQYKNPNTNTTFQGSNIRSYSFSFKMVSRTKQDSEAIKDIISFFKKYMYPEGNVAMMSYPPLWKIAFYNGSDQMKHLPKIAESYLTSMSTSYNSSTNMWHEDGSPIEVDVTINFQETRTLTRTDLAKLEGW